MNKKLLSLRKNSGLSQLELAEKLGVSRSCISAWERGTRLPSVLALLKYQKLFSLDKNYFSEALSMPRIERISVFDLTRLNYKGAAALYEFYSSLLENEEYLKKS